jgi:hypothetical protein
VFEVEVREQRKRPPDADNERATTQDRAPRRTLPRQGNRDADNEEEKWKNEIGGRPSVPRRVFERPIHMAAVARIVHDDHRGHRQTAKDVERDKTRR